MLLETKSLPRVGLRGSLPRIVIMKCDECDVTFERPFSKVFFEDRKKHACSLRCGQRLRPKLRYTEIGCLQCETKFERYIGNIHERNFCSRDCMNLHRREHPELWPDNSNAMNTPEAKISSKKTLQRLRESPDFVHPRLGKHHSEETKKLISEHHKETGCVDGENNGMFGRNHTQASRDAMSETRTKRMIEGKYKEYGRNKHQCGTYSSSKMSREFWYRSSWELACMKHLDASEDVTAWEYESMRIPYYYENHKRWYVPDFLVMFKDDHREMWEVKPQEFVETMASKLKQEAALKYCSENDVQSYKYMTKLVLKDMGIL